MESMNEASEAIDGDPTTYARTGDRPGQNWTITFDNSFTISCIFIRIRGGKNCKLLLNLTWKNIQLQLIFYP